MNLIFFQQLKKLWRKKYDIYTKSNRFKRDIDSIKIDEGKRIAVLYEFVAKNFCVYYLDRKEQKKKSQKKIIFKILNK